MVFQKIYKKPVKAHPVLDAMRWNVPNCIRSDAWWIDLEKLRLRHMVNLVTSMSFVFIAGFIVSIQGQAMDVSHASTLSELPIMIHQQYKHSIPLLAKEQAYFTQYGGDAKKAIYGDRQLLLTKTSSPLRHLHSPDECLRGLGFKVSFLGSIDSPIPSSIYKATSPSGDAWKVAVSFVSQQGYIASNVSEAVWKWMKNDRHSANGSNEWLSLQRISPWESDFNEDRKWDTAVLQALEIPLNPSI